MCSVEYVNTSELFSWILAVWVYNSRGLSVLYAQWYESHFFLFAHSVPLYTVY